DDFHPHWTNGNDALTVEQHGTFTTALENRRARAGAQNRFDSIAWGLYAGRRADLFLVSQNQIGCGQHSGNCLPVCVRAGPEQVTVVRIENGGMTMAT